MATTTTASTAFDVPLPIVTFSRWVYAVILAASLFTQQALLSSVLLLCIVAGLIGGKRWSIIHAIAQKVLMVRLKNRSSVPLEDARAIRFNNALLAVMLALANVAFWTGLPMLGWVIVACALAAVGAALAGICVGCIVFYRWKLYRFRLLSE
jgi:hypothetical protein